MSKYRHVDSMLHECKACNARFRIKREDLPEKCPNCKRLRKTEDTLRTAQGMLMVVATCGQYTEQFRKDARKTARKLSKLIKEGTL